MCETCTLLTSDRVITSDEHVAVIIGRTSAPSVIVAPKQHGSLHELPKEVQQRLFTTANQLSSLIFDTLGVHGTNVLVDDAEHSRYLVVGRMEDDGLELRWKPSKTSKEELDKSAKRIAEETWYIGKEEKKKHASTLSEEQLPAHTHEKKEEEPRDVAANLQKHVKSGPTSEHNYLIKHLTRKR